MVCGWTQWTWWTTVDEHSEHGEQLWMSTVNMVNNCGWTLWTTVDEHFEHGEQLWMNTLNMVNNCGWTKWTWWKTVDEHNKHGEQLWTNTVNMVNNCGWTQLTQRTTKLCTFILFYFIYPFAGAKETKREHKTIKNKNVQQQIEKNIAEGRNDNLWSWYKKIKITRL